jgi:hypothetical protein
VSPLAWLAIPVVGLVLGVLWALWTSRTRPRADTHETLSEHARFKAAFDREQPGGRPRGD